MIVKDIIFLRLQQQQLLKQQFKKSEEVVKWLGAVQAQDYLGALWAVGLRTKMSRESDVEQALADKTIVRTWPMRGTLHVVAAADVQWMCQLLTPRVVEAQAKRLKRDYEIDRKVIQQGKKVIVRALQGGRQLSREALYKTLEGAKIPAGDQRGLHILWWLAQEGLLCFGTREGKQQTFTLLNEWIPPGKARSRNESLAELALRYFTSHAPATLQDFTWWSGLSPADSKAAFEMVRRKFIEEKVADRIYIMPSDISNPLKRSQLLMLPSFDEYTVGYTDRRAVLDAIKTTSHGNGIFNPILVIDGKISGTWKRTIKKDNVNIEVKSFSSLNETQRGAIEKKADVYGAFINKKVSSIRFIR